MRVLAKIKNVCELVPQTSETPLISRPKKTFWAK